MVDARGDGDTWGVLGRVSSSIVRDGVLSVGFVLNAEKDGGTRYVQAVFTIIGRQL